MSYNYKSRASTVIPYDPNDSRAELVSRWYAKLFLICAQVFPELPRRDREDLVHDAVMNLLKSNKKDLTDNTFSAYMRRVIINTHYKNLRLKREKVFKNVKDHGADIFSKYRESLDRLVAQYGFHTNSEQIDYELIKTLLKNNIVPTQFEAFELATQGFSRQEIADELGISERNANTRVYLAKKKCKTILRSVFEETI